MHDATHDHAEDHAMLPPIPSRAAWPDDPPEPRKPVPPDPTRGPRPYPVDDPGIGEPDNKPGSEPDYVPGRVDSPPTRI